MKICMLVQVICSLSSSLFAVCSVLKCGWNEWKDAQYMLSCSYLQSVMYYAYVPCAILISPFYYLANLSLLPSHGEVFVYIFLLHEKNEWMDVCRLR